MLGYFANYNNNKIVMTIIQALLLLIICIAFYKKDKQNKHIIFILGGALGNIFDRFSYGFIIDFIDIHYLDKHWYIFNLADIYILIGVIISILYIKKIKIN